MMVIMKGRGYFFLLSVEIYFMEQRSTLSQLLKSKRMNLVKDYNPFNLVLYETSKYVYFSFLLFCFTAEGKAKITVLLTH